MSCRLLLIFFFCNQILVAQNEICTGNLGDNIFESGDFGTGQVNIPPKPDDLISTYTYVSAGPPFDGSFTITNNTGAWPNLFQTWVATLDNGADADGYFMVVNADFQPGIFYEQTIDGLCENTLYVFTADILNIVRIGVADHILPNVSFLLNDVEQFTTGGIPQDERWNTYGFTFTTGPGETTKKLSLRNNAPGGIGNDLAIDNIAFQACGPIAEILPRDIANICEDGDPILINATVTGDQFGAGQAFQWQQSFDEGLTWENIEFATTDNFEHTETRAGFYYYRYLLANAESNLSNPKCRVNSNVKIIQVVPKFWEIKEDLCIGLSFQVGNTQYNETGIFTDSLISSLGCDSIVTLDLTIVDEGPIRPRISPEDPLCANTDGGSIGVSTIQNAREPFRITLGDRTSSSFVRFVGLEAGSYEIFIEDDVGCTFDTIIELIDPEPFVIDLGEDLTLDLGESVSINPISNFPIAQFEWTPNNQTLSEEDDINQNFTPINSALYTLTATSDLGCIAVDDVFIRINAVREVYIPNVFSPNGDGQNDFFAIFPGIPNVQTIQEVGIYDRWGNLVFTRQNINPTDGTQLWDGQFNNQFVGTGAYLYAVRILFLDGEEEWITGTVTVVY